MNQDARDLLAAVAASPAGVHTLATVVAIDGSSYRRPGARLLVHADGVTIGSVSGGCLERAIVQRGRWWAERGPVVRGFTSAADPDDPDDAAPGCGGSVDVLVEQVRADDAGGALAALRWIAARRAPACLATVIRGGAALPLASRCAITASEAWCGASGIALAARCEAAMRAVLAAGTSSWLRDGDLVVFLEHLAAPRELLVVGRHHDVAPVVRMARMVGWDVTVAATGVAPRMLGEPEQVIALEPAGIAGWAAARPGAAVVIMTHDLGLDGRVLGAVLDAAAPGYLGVLGPRHRTAALLGNLAAPARALAALRTPVGLDLGGDGPEAIALSLVADLQATWHRRSGVRLCPPGSWARPASAPHARATSGRAPATAAPASGAPAARGRPRRGDTTARRRATPARASP